MASGQLRAARTAVVWGATALASGCGLSGEPIGERATASAVSGPWIIPLETLAIGDTQFVEYTGGGAWDEARCTGGLTPGAAIVRAYLRQHFPQADDIGGYSCRPISGSTTSMSVHGLGRALDVMIDLDGDDADNGLGDPVGNFLVENAEAIGIQYIIWDHWKWRADQPAGEKDGPYGGVSPHIDHLHVELSVEAAARTEPWFEGTVTPPEAELPSGCAAVPADGAVIDDGSPCVARYGPAAYWRAEAGVGYGGGLHWTDAYESATPSNWGRWHLAFETADRYTVEVYLDPAFAVASDVRYQVVAGGASAELSLDQSSADGWTLLGTFDFAAGAGQAVSVYDNVEGPVAADQHIALDALRLARTGPPSADAGPAAIDAGPGRSVDAEPGAPADPGGEGLFGGCAAAPRGGRASWLAASALGLLAVRIARRRRRTGRP